MSTFPAILPQQYTGGLLPATGLANRKILLEKNIKKRTGPALCAYNSKHMRELQSTNSQGVVRVRVKNKKINNLHKQL
jgi:hypothetical protein